MTRILRSKKTLFVVYVCVFLAVFVMTCLTPMLADDFSYSFSYAEYGKRITSLGDVFRSLGAHRRSMNGRMFSHGLAMLFLMGPKMIFNVCNALNSCLQLALLYRYFADERKERSLALLLLGLFSIWIFMPAFGQVYLWLDGSLNYSWAMTVLLAFLYPFFCEYQGRPYRIAHHRLLQILFLLLAFVAGGYSENASCAGLFMAFCFGALVLLQKRKLPAYLYGAFALAVACFLFMMTAPAEGGRAAQMQLLGIARNIQRVFAAPQEKLLAVYCAFAVLLTLSFLRGVERKWIGAALVLFAGSIVSVIVFALAVYFPWRSLCATTIYLLLACLLLLKGLWDTELRYLPPCLTAIAAVVVAFSFVLGLGDITVMYMESRQREATILAAVAAGEDTVAVHRYSSNTKYAAANDLPDVYDDAGQWPNCDMALYYGIGSIQGLPPVEDFGSE